MDKEYQTITIERDTGTARYTILKSPGRADQFLTKMVNATKLNLTGAEGFAKARRDQMRTYATPTERARILAENPVEIEEEA